MHSPSKKKKRPTWRFSINEGTQKMVGLGKISFKWMIGGYPYDILWLRTPIRTPIIGPWGAAHLQANSPWCCKTAGLRLKIIVLELVRRIRCISISMLDWGIDLDWKSFSFWKGYFYDLSCLIQILCRKTFCVCSVFEIAVSSSSCLFLVGNWNVWCLHHTNYVFLSCNWTKIFGCVWGVCCCSYPCENKLWLPLWKTEDIMIMLIFRIPINQHPWKPTAIWLV